MKKSLDTAVSIYLKDFPIKVGRASQNKGSQRPLRKQLKVDMIPTRPKFPQIQGPEPIKGVRRMYDGWTSAKQSVTVAQKKRAL